MPGQIGWSGVSQSGSLRGVTFDPALNALDNQLLGGKVMGRGLVTVGLVARLPVPNLVQQPAPTEFQGQLIDRGRCAHS